MNTEKPLSSSLRICFAVTLAASVSSALAQTAPAPSPAPATSAAKSAQDGVVALDPYEVVMTEYTGYNTPNSGMALRTNENIMEVPQSISVITRDMINDLGSENTSDFVNYSGGSNFFQGDSAMLRGVRVSMYADGVVDYNFDPVTTDSVTVVRGPVGVLYGVGQTGNLGGAILKNTRTPTGRNGGSVVARFDQWNFQRVELDYSGVIGKIGDAKFSYRLDYAKQSGRFYWKPLSNDRDVAYLVLEMKRPTNTLRLNYTYSNIKADPHRNFFVTPEGEVYNGWDRDDAYFSTFTNNSKVKRRDRTVRILFNQQLGGNWNLALRGAASRNYYNQGVLLNSGVNWATREIVFSSRNNNLGQRLFSGSMDVTGDYLIWKRKFRTSFGAQIQDNTNKPNYFGQDPVFGTDNAARGIGRRAAGLNNFVIPATGRATFLAVPVDNPRMEDIMIRNSAYYFDPAVAGVNYGSRSETWQTNFYAQQNVDILPRRFTVVGSLAQFNQVAATENRPFAAQANPQPATISPPRVNELLHRVGFLLRVTKDIGIYGLQSQSVTPQNARLFDGTFAGAQSGSGKEIGFKTDLLDGRISATVGFFDIELQDVAINTGLVSPITNQTYSNLIGKQLQRGGDISLFMRPIPNWQVTLNYYKGSVKDQNGYDRIPNTFTGAWSILTRYDFKTGALKKFAVGGGANRQTGRLATANTLILPSGTTPPTVTGINPALRLKDGTMSNLWVSYAPNKKWTIQLQVLNALDERFAVGHQHTAAIDPSQPRTIQTQITHRF
jgi:iron complex outermembrane receptor protein